MTELELRRCPVCGAPVASAAPSCSYCHAPLASVHCAACFTLNPVSAVHCAGCGEKLGLAPLELTVDLTCPHCEAPFRAFAGAGGKLCECERCGGKFVEHALLAELLERRELHHHPVTQTLPPRSVRTLEPVRYLKCPLCGTRMNRNNFGGTSGIVVDVCPRHGVWFDAGELARILEFVQAGGLERARERARQERTAHERAEHLEAISARSPGHAVPWPSGEGAAFGWRSLGAEALELFEYVVGTLRRRP